MYVKAWGKLGKWPPNVLIFHPFLSPSTARCCHMLESRWDQFIYLSGLPSYEKRMQHSKMQIYLIRVVGVKGVTKNNKIPAALSGHMQRSPESTRPPSQSTSRWKYASPPTLPCRFYLQPGHWEPVSSCKLTSLDTSNWAQKWEVSLFVTFNWYKISTRIGNLAAELCDVRSCTERLLFLK